MKKYFVLILMFLLTIAPVIAFELDLSVDEDIRKNYDSSKLENEVLPDLPNVLKQPDPGQKPQTIQTQIKTQTQVQDVPKGNINTDFSGSNKVKKNIPSPVMHDSYTEIKVKKGTKFKVKSQTKVSDWNTAGARMTFVSVSPVVKRYVSFPIGTTFKGVIEESHQPNFGGNGGLLKLKADNIVVNGNFVHIDAKVTKADGKNIFFNNIKGKRGYAKGVAAHVKKGENFYNKTRKVSGKMKSNPVGAVLSPIPTVFGALGYGVNLIVSPVAAIGSKGAHITLPAGTDYTLKLREDLYLNK